ncbi:hypothetical protein VTN49DRAFT_4241 [Thermomyces lanuginosus]|uniref:uncharacterized protein n=1 Tax=Thermomyces lanuginosus TaxID=5541 RepID=UPI0037431E1D
MSQILPTPTVILPHLPSKILVGIDLLSFTATDKFHGISDLPKGWHFLYTGTTESFSLRCGVWFYVGDGKEVSASEPQTDKSSTAVVHQSSTTPADSAEPEVRIWTWNKESESLLPLGGETDEERVEVMRWKANLGGLRQKGELFRYRTSGFEGATNEENRKVAKVEGSISRAEWTGLTEHITPQLLTRVLGDPQIDYNGRPTWSITSGSTASRDADNIPNISSSSSTGPYQETELRFLPIDLKRTWREGAVGRERTEAAQDRSWALGDLISRYSSPDDPGQGEKQILGELQLCFAMVLTLMNYSCLEQWKRLLSLILTCRKAIVEREAFFVDVLRLLRLQLGHCDDVEGGVFEMDAEDASKLLRKLLMDFRRSVDEITGDNAQSAVRREMDTLEKYVQKRFDWELRKEAILRRGMVQLEDGEQVELTMEGADEDEETGEYAPVVVEMPDDMRAMTTSSDEEMVL